MLSLCEEEILQEQGLLLPSSLPQDFLKTQNKALSDLWKAVIPRRGFPQTQLAVRRG